MSGPVARGHGRKNVSLCDGRGRTGIYHAHAFVPSGTSKQYGCVQSGRCRSRGVHEACAVCGWPADEHPGGGVGMTRAQQARAARSQVELALDRSGWKWNERLSRWIDYLLTREECGA
jgi:hypothetical protein